MKLFLRKISYFLPIAVLMLMINMLYDPANIFHREYEREAANIILSGKNVVGLSNYNDRIFQQLIITGERRTPDTVILGSSRVMTLSDEAIEDMGVYRNLGVSGAVLYDDLGMLGIYAEKGELPKRVIFGLDPWILNDQAGDRRYETLEFYIESLQKKMRGERSATKHRSISTGTLEMWMQLFSPSYLRSSILEMIKAPLPAFRSKEVNYYGTDERIVDDNIRYTDGSVDYNFTTRNKSVSEINEEARAYVIGNVYHMELFYKLSKANLELLVEVIDYLETQGTEVIFFLPPFHPFVYQYLSTHSDYERIIEAEDCFRDIARQRNIAVWGSYDPETLGCEEIDFFDGMHMKRSSIKKAWKVCDKIDHMIELGLTAGGEY